MPIYFINGKVYEAPTFAQAFRLYLRETHPDKIIVRVGERDMLIGVPRTYN